MPSLPDQALDRIRRLSKMLKDAEQVSSEEIEAWSILTFGIRPRTTALYLNALHKMGLVDIDFTTKVVTWKQNSA